MHLFFVRASFSFSAKNEKKILKGYVPHSPKFKDQSWKFFFFFLNQTYRPTGCHDFYMQKKIHG